MKKKVIIGATILGTHLGAVVGTAQADGLYSDHHLHRSDEMIRFDRAYRQGLKDAAPTIIYYQERAEEDCCGRDGQKDAQGRYPNTKQYEPGKPVARVATAEGSLTAQQMNEERIRKLQEAREKLMESKRMYEAARAKDTGPDASVSTPVTSDEGKVKPVAVKDKPQTASLLTTVAETPSPEEAPLTRFELDPDLVKNQRVPINMTGTIEEIARAMLPRGWELKISVSEDKYLSQKFEFITTETRDMALRDLLRGTPLGFKYFFTLVDESGNPAPVLVIAAINEA